MLWSQSPSLLWCSPKGAVQGTACLRYLPSVALAPLELRRLFFFFFLLVLVRAWPLISRDPPYFIHVSRFSVLFSCPIQDLFYVPDFI